MSGSTISPLAPKGGFAELPIIDGVRFASIAAGIKYQDRDDVMLAEVCAGASVAGVFTRSATRSPPVLWCETHIGNVDAAKPVGILVNSGNANAFTGGAGTDTVNATVAKTADVLGTVTGNIFPASTGVIGERLPPEQITGKLDALAHALDAKGAKAAAHAIMTTDTFAKGASAACDVGGVTVSIAGFAKGSGMIEPDMGTMLVYIFTDAAIEQSALQAMVSDLTEVTFNAITVDSDTSTSDSLIVAATGKAGNGAIEGSGFRDALHSVMLDLAHQVVRDGEGASKFVEVAVSGAQSDASAKIVAKSIANSPLVKTAIAGEDPNWGRIVMAIGKAGEPADRDKITIHFGDVLVAEMGWVADSYTEAAGAAYMKGETLRIAVDMGIGAGQSTVWTCDLTHQYITINADYRS